MDDDQKAKLRTAVRKAIDRFPPEVRYRSLNAWNGLELAERLLDIDREIASFRALTAQEEAAAALFAALKRKKYPGSDRLNLREHPHKVALWPFLDAVKHKLAKDLDQMNLKFVVDPDAPSVELKIRLSEFGVTLPGMPDAAIMPVHPLDLLHSHNGAAYMFEAEINEIASARGATAIDRHVRTLANQRNRLLYATEQALPASKATLRDIEHRRDQVVLVLVLTIAILQTSVHQKFAVQCLHGFLKIIGKGRDLDELSEPDSSDAILLTRVPHGDVEQAERQKEEDEQ